MGIMTRVVAFAGIAATLSAAVVSSTLVLAGPSPTAVHQEREPTPTDVTGRVPTARTSGSELLVCGKDAAAFTQRIAAFPKALAATNRGLWSRCQSRGFRTLQEAVDAVTRPGQIIKLLPGTYVEEPSLVTTSAFCAKLPATRTTTGEQVLSWEQQTACRHNQSLVAVLDKHDLQIEGTGATPADVVLDGQFRKPHVLRADRSPGLYLRNFTSQHGASSAIYLMETDGFAVDNVVGRWNGQFGVLGFNIDHGRVTRCETYGNSAAGIFTGWTADLNADRGVQVDRFAVEIDHCRSHHNLHGYSGIAGSSVWAHDNTFTDNSVGVSTGSAASAYSGRPQNHARFEHNTIAANNKDYYHHVRDGTCAKALGDRDLEGGTVCPTIGVPVGTGVVNAGGNHNVWRENWVYDNHYAGFLTSWVPGFARGDNTATSQFDTSHHNRYVANVLGHEPDGAESPNGLDFWWDGQGVGDCWQAPTGQAQPRTLPRCGTNEQPGRFAPRRFIAEPLAMVKLNLCGSARVTAAHLPQTCDWYGARGSQRIEVRWAIGEAILLSLMALLLWGRLLYNSFAGFLGLVFTLGGAAGGVYSQLHHNQLMTAAALGTLGMGLLHLGVPLRGRHRPGVSTLSVTIAMLAMLNAVDVGLVMLPWTPVSPALPRLLLEVLWVPWAFAAAMRGRVYDDLDWLPSLRPFASHRDH